VLRLVAQGLTNAQIAERLTLSPHTVDNHVRSILSKPGGTSRSGATRFAFEQHLLSNPRERGPVRLLASNEAVRPALRYA
jgi:ATP/maltotriose-dependent transcriptional regulator MalT